MSAPASSPPSNPWDHLVDYNKAVVTLATALLGLTLTFVDDYAPLAPKPLLYIGWVLITGAIVLSVLSVALAVNYLKNGNKADGSILSANVGYFMLVGGMVLLGLAGIISFAQAKKPPSVEELVGLAMSEAHAATEGATDDRWSFVSLSADRAYQHYTIVLASEAERSLRVVIQSDPLRIQSIE